ncbi:hypothetical protein ACFGVR_01510 [Mucilaginibacter sp. AW1-3]
MYTGVKRKSSEPAVTDNATAQRKGVAMPAVPVLQQAVLQKNTADEEPLQGKLIAQLQDAGIVQRVIAKKVWDEELVPNISLSVYTNLGGGDTPLIGLKDDVLVKKVGTTVTPITDEIATALRANHTWDGKLINRTKVKDIVNEDTIDLTTPGTLHSNIDSDADKVKMNVEDVAGDRHSFLHHSYSIYKKRGTGARAVTTRREAGHHLTVENAHLLAMLELKKKKTLGHLDKTTLEKPDVNTELGKRKINEIDNLNFFPKKAQQTAKALSLGTGVVSNDQLEEVTTDMASENVDERLSLGQYLSFIQKGIESIPNVPPVYGAKILQTAKTMHTRTGLNPAEMFLKVGKGDQRHLVRAVLTMAHNGLAAGFVLEKGILDIFQHYVTNEPKLPFATPITEETEWVAKGALANDGRTNYNALETRYVDGNYEAIVTAMKTYIA